MSVFKVAFHVLETADDSASVTLSLSATFWIACDVSRQQYGKIRKGNYLDGRIDPQQSRGDPSPPSILSFPLLSSGLPLEVGPVKSS